MEPTDAACTVEHWNHMMAGRPECRPFSTMSEGKKAVWAHVRFGETVVVPQVLIGHRGGTTERLYVFDYSRPAAADRLVAYREGHCVFDVRELIAIRKSMQDEGLPTQAAVTKALTGWIDNIRRLDPAEVQEDFFIARAKLRPTKGFPRLDLADLAWNG